MKKPLWKITAPIVLILFVLLAFVSCGGKAETTNEVTDEAAKGAFKLDVSANIPEAATVEGSGYYDYNENISASVNVKEGYEFLGWYFNETDLLSSQTVYNGKMWNQDVVLKAIVIKCPEGVSIGGASDPTSTYTLNVSTVNEECGLVSLNDGANETEYTAAFNPGRTFKILAYSKTTKRFLGWYGTSGELITTNASLSLTMPGFNYDLVAVWEGEKIPNVNDFTYIINENQGCSITGYKGSDTSLVFPSSIKGTVVTSIGNLAFEGCSALTSVTIPNSVTSIGYEAFSGCSSLASVTIGNGVTFIGDYAFRGCSGLTSVTIPDSVTSIGAAAFADCSGLTSVTIGNGVTSIGDSAFYGCSGLTSVTIPDSVTSIGAAAFADCSGLTSVTIGNGVTSIGDSAFYGCSGLTSITIPDSVTSIGSVAFSGCSGLTSVTIPDSVTSIGGWVFSGCLGLTSLTVADENPYYHSAGNCIIQTATKALIAGCKNSIIPTDGSVSSIVPGSFGDCSNLTSIDIPNGVISIAPSAFEGCFGLASVTIPKSVTYIGFDSFSGCFNLTSITYHGTKAQWNAISKESDWNVRTGAYTIHCTDGDIAK